MPNMIRNSAGQWEIANVAAEMQVLFVLKKKGAKNQTKCSCFFFNCFLNKYLKILRENV